VLDHKSLFISSYEADCVYIQQWAGDVLWHASVADKLEDIVGVKKKIILWSVPDIAHEIDAAKELIKHNFFVMINPHEIHSPWQLLQEIPELSRFPFVLGGRNPAVQSLNLDSFYFLTHSDVNEMLAKRYTIDHVFQKKSKPYTFLYLNGAAHWHRKVLWEAIDQRRLLDDSLSSFLGYQHGIDAPLQKLLPNDYEFPCSRINDHVASNKTDYARFKTQIWKNQWVDGQIFPNQYIDTYFSVVCETTVDMIFCTEKTYKPILAGHPFIILSGAGTYQYLKELGFKTFDPWIDESFDLEPDPNVRIKMIADQIEKLCQGNLADFLQQVEPVCRHNQEFYLSNREKLFHHKHMELRGFLETIMTDAEQYFDRSTI